MSCKTKGKRCAHAHQGPSGVPTGAMNPTGQRQCPKCGGWLRKDGGCTKCEGKNDENGRLSPTLAMATTSSTGKVEWDYGAGEEKVIFDSIEEAVDFVKAAPIAKPALTGEGAVELNYPGGREKSFDSIEEALDCANDCNDGFDLWVYGSLYQSTIKNHFTGKYETTVFNTLSAISLPDIVGRMELSCGHNMVTKVSPGDEEWCDQCDDWTEVVEPFEVPPGAASADPSSIPEPAYALPEPSKTSGPGKVQLWSVLEEVAKREDITVERGPYLGYAPSDGKGYGKVYGGFYGQDKGGDWYSVTAYGPIGAAKVRVDEFGTRAGAESHFYKKKQAKVGRGKYSELWPCDSSGKGFETCPRCSRLVSLGAACHCVAPKRAKAAAGRAVEDLW